MTTLHVIGICFLLYCIYKFLTVVSNDFDFDENNFWDGICSFIGFIASIVSIIAIIGFVIKLMIKYLP